MMKKLIPCNLVMLLIALAGALSLIFMPLLSLNLGEVANHILEDPDSGEELFGTPDLGEEGEEPSDTPEGGEDPSETPEDGGGDLSILTSLLDTEIEITTVKLGKIATAENADAAFLTQFLLYKGGPIENILLGSIVSTSVISATLLGDDAIGKIDYHALRTVLTELEAENADTDEIIEKYVGKLREQVGEDAFQFIDEEELRGAITDSVNAVKDTLGGKFSAEALVCIALTGDEEGGPTTYEELAMRLAKGDPTLDEETGGTVNFLGTMIGMVASYGSYLRYGFYAMLVFLLPWALFILLCALHIFLRNKRVATWYLFTFGCLPCILFWLTPMIARPLLPKLFEGMGYTISAALGAVSSLAWVSGLCLVIMWLLWLFWMRPLKKRAKAEMRVQQAARRHYR